MSSKDKFRIVSGIPFPAEMPDLLCHLQLFLKSPEYQREPEKVIVRGEPYIYEGSGRFEHSKIISQILYKKGFEWHEWSDRIERAACESDYLCISGPGASSKSTSIADHALKFWMCAPLDSAVIMASKTIDNSKNVSGARFHGFTCYSTSSVGIGMRFWAISETVHLPYCWTRTEER
jgi:hypothetical protein